MSFKYVKEKVLATHWSPPKSTIRPLFLSWNGDGGDQNVQEKPSNLYILDLPQDVLHIIFSFLNASERWWPRRSVLLVAAGVCKSWRRVSLKILRASKFLEGGQLDFTHPLRLLTPSPLMVECYVRRERPKNSMGLKYRRCQYNLYLGADFNFGGGKFLLSAVKVGPPWRSRLLISTNPDSKSASDPSCLALVTSNVIGTKFRMKYRVESEQEKQRRDSKNFEDVDNDNDANITNTTNTIAAASEIARGSVSYKCNILGIQGPRRLSVALDEGRRRTSPSLSSSNTRRASGSPVGGSPSPPPHSPLPSGLEDPDHYSDSEDEEAATFRASGSRTGELSSWQSASGGSGNGGVHSFAEVNPAPTQGNAILLQSSLYQSQSHSQSNSQSNSQSHSHSNAHTAEDQTEPCTPPRRVTHWNHLGDLSWRHFTSNSNSNTTAANTTTTSPTTAINRFNSTTTPPASPSPNSPQSQTMSSPPSSPQQTAARPKLELHNKAPRWHEELQCWCLDFQGRVSRASVKNFQLTYPDSDQLVLQFGKVGLNLFTMDFKEPFSVVQAFAVCLSSFEFKLACE